MEALTNNANDVQHDAYKDYKKKICMKIFFVHKCVDTVNFQNIENTTPSKTWKILEYFDMNTLFTNQMKSYGEVVSDQTIVNKVICSHHPNLMQCKFKNQRICYLEFRIAMFIGIS